MIVGHRALVAYGREDGRYDVYYSHWGGADLALARQLADPATDPVADEPLSRAVEFAAVVGQYLDPLVHEALFVVDDEPRVYRTLWFGFGGGVDSSVDESSAGGLLVGVDWTDPCDDAHVRAWFAGARAVAAACHKRGELSQTMAATVVERALRDWADDREVIRPPATSGTGRTTGR